MDRGTTRRIVLTGPECTGKTTLAARLASDMGGAFLREQARAYAEEVARPLTVNDVEPIGRRTISAEVEARALDVPLLVLDTDLLSTIVYGRHYYDFRSPELERQARAHHGGIYLLCAPDIPWEPDGIRDSPDNREEMFGKFRDVLLEFGAKYTEIRGGGDARYAAVKAAAALPAAP